MDTLKLDGRDFTTIKQTLTANQDDYILAHLRLSGVMDILADAGQKRTPEEKAQAVLTRILESGRKPFLLAGLLTEVGKEWNRDEANRNAKVFGSITSDPEITLMRQGIVSYVIGFFSLGERSSTSSPKSSRKNGRDRRTASAAP